MAEHLKTPKLKGSDIDTETAARQRSRRLQPGAQDAGRKRLNVGPDHRTAQMQRKRRGSFP